MLETQHGEAVANLEELHKEATSMEGRSVRILSIKFAVVLVIIASSILVVTVQITILCQTVMLMVIALMAEQFSAGVELLLRFVCAGQPGKLVSSTAPRRFSASK